MLKPVVYLALMAGLRLGEIQNLSWDDCDFENDLIYVRPKSDWEPKTKKSRRKVPMHPLLKSYLLDRKERLGGCLPVWVAGRLGTGERYGKAFLVEKMRKLFIAADCYEKGQSVSASSTTHSRDHIREVRWSDV